jgi:hypothetical protein
MKTRLTAVVLFSTLFVYACATENYNTQKGAAIGALGGALAGQAIGRNTEGTLIGAAAGALVGAVAGNAVDQSNQERREQAQAPTYAAPPPPPVEETPPGQWVDVPGRWVDGKWVPAHRAWVPVNPGGAETSNVPLPPPYAPPAPPEMAVIPGTYAYFVPGGNADVFFYRGSWYRPWRNHWYWAPAYGGPWAYLPARRVPGILVTLPPGYRRLPPGYRPIPHAELVRNWERWEHERRWDHR